MTFTAEEMEMIRQTMIAAVWMYEGEWGSGVSHESPPARQRGAVAEFYTNMTDRIVDWLIEGL